MRHVLRMTDECHLHLKSHLFPGDKKEAIAFALCGRITTSNLSGLLVHKILLIPHDVCDRRGDFIEWPTSLIDDLIDEASVKGMGILKIHSHPEGRSNFSILDDESDRIIFPSIYALMNDEQPHISAIMYDDGSIQARAVSENGEFVQIDRVMVIGNEVNIFDAKGRQSGSDLSLRNIQTFGQGTVNLLKALCVTVIGCSGTGSIAIEQLIRLGVGKIIVADPDVIESKNLNRILNSTLSDSETGIPKVKLTQRTANSIGFDTEIISYQTLLQEDPELLDTVIESDFVIGSVDSIEGRHILNNLSTFYLIPYIDMGVKLVTDKKGGIDEISGSVHYIQPGKSSLLSRGVFTSDGLAAESMKRINPEMYDEQRKNGYVVDVNVESPAVLPINMQVASLAILEFLARIHPYRYDDNRHFAQTHISISDWEIWKECEGAPDKYLKKFVGSGNLRPRLNISSIDSVWK